MKRGGFARATLLLVDISKVKLLKGNSTSKTNRKWALGWLTDGSGVCVCVCFPWVCVSSENHFSLRGGEWRDIHTPVCLYWSHSVSLAKSGHCFSFVLSIKTVCRCLNPSTYIFWLGSSILGSHFGLLDGGQIGSSNGQRGSSTKKKKKRDKRDNEKYCGGNQDKHNYAIVGGIKTIQCELVCHILNISPTFFLWCPRTHTIQHNYE